MTALTRAVYDPRSPFDYRCPATQDGHRFHDKPGLSKWETLLYCERCGRMVNVDIQQVADMGKK